MKVDDFFVGDRVKHHSRGDGVVERIGTVGGYRCVEVAFTDHSARGAYDDVWLRTFPDGLRRLPEGPAK